MFTIELHSKVCVQPKAEKDLRKLDPKQEKQILNWLRVRVAHRREVYLKEF